MKKWSYIIGSLLATSVIVFAFQNCNSGLTKMGSTLDPNSTTSDAPADAGNRGPQAQSTDCQGSVLSWQVGAYSCSASAPALTANSEQVILDNGGDIVGSATARCENGSLFISGSQPQVCRTNVVNTVTNGACGPLHNTTVDSISGGIPANQLCAAGNASMIIGTGPWTWTCAGLGVSSQSANCSAQKTASTAVNGQCGSSHNQTFASAPSGGLCASGSATTVSGSGPWTWSCTGQGGGTSASCSANKTTTVSQTPQCGAATVGSRGYTSLSEFTSNDYCFTGGSQPTNLQGGSNGPWAWNCVNSNGESSAQCKASKQTIQSCGGSNGVKTGSRICLQKYGEIAVTCGDCIPTVCDTGYQMTGAPARCETLNTGTCAIPAGKMKIRAQSTLEYLSCEATVSAQTLSPGNSIPVGCVNGGFSALTAVKCSQETLTNATDNGGVPYQFKRLYYRHGRINSNDSDEINWAYASFGIRSSGYIFDEHIAREITYNFSCRSTVDFSISSWNYSGGPGFYLSGTGLNPTSPGTQFKKCAESEGGQLHLVTIACDGAPPATYEPIPYGSWKITNAVPATPTASGCSAGGATGTYSWSR